MDINNLEKLNLNGIAQKIIKVAMEHSEEGSDLQKELLSIVEMVEKEQTKVGEIKNAFYLLLSKM